MPDAYPHVLPLDILRDILEENAREDFQVAMAYLTLSKTIHGWISRLIPRSLTLVDRDTTMSFASTLRTLRMAPSCIQHLSLCTQDINSIIVLSHCPDITSLSVDPQLLTIPHHVGLALRFTSLENLTFTSLFERDDIQFLPVTIRRLSIEPSAYLTQEDWHEVATRCTALRTVIIQCTRLSRTAHAVALRRLVTLPDSPFDHIILEGPVRTADYMLLLRVCESTHHPTARTAVFAPLLKKNEQTVPVMMWDECFRYEPDGECSEDVGDWPARIAFWERVEEWHNEKLREPRTTPVL